MRAATISARRAAARSGDTDRIRSRTVGTRPSVAGAEYEGPWTCASKSVVQQGMRNAY